MSDIRISRLARLATLTNVAIDTSDIPEVPDWSDAIRGRLYRPCKQADTIRLDADLIAYFKAAGGPYRTGLNRALREWLRERGKSRCTG